MMDKFEKQFDNLDVVSGVMEKTIESSTASATPEEEVDQLIRMAAQRNDLELGEAFDSAGVGKGSAVKTAAVKPAAPVAVSAAAPSDDMPPAPPTTKPGGSGGGGAPGAGSGDGGGDASAALHARLAALRK